MTLDPVAEFRSALKASTECQHHGPLAVSTSRANAAEWWDTMKQCSAQQRREHLRWFGRHDLFFLLFYILRRKHLCTDFHFDRCQDVQRQPTNVLDVWAREHAKSEILTLGQNIRDVLNNPDITIGIFSHTRPMAKGFLRLIKVEFEQNETLKELYPDVLYRDPKNQSPKWSEDDGITVIREANRKESTIEAWGLIDGQPTSKRFMILHYDDVISRKEISNEMIDKAMREFENSFALTASDPPLFRYLATIQEIGDTTHQLIQKKFAPLRLHPWVDENKRPVLFSEEKVSWILKNLSPKVVALQYELDPKKAMTDVNIGFDARWIRMEPPAFDRNDLARYIVVDPAGTGPHANSKFALWVLGIDAFKVWHALDGVLDSLGLHQRADAVLAMVKKWKPLKVGYETYSMQGDIEYLHERAKAENITITVIKLGGNRDKDKRIEQLMPVLRDNKLAFPLGGIPYLTSKGERINIVDELVQKEYPVWPYGKSKDLLDSLSRITDPALGVVPPRAYGGTAVRTGDPWSQGASGTGSWMSE